MKSALTVSTLVLFSALAIGSARASDVAFTGKSASYVYGQLDARAEGVVRSARKTITGKSVRILSLDNGLMKCELKDNRVFKDSTQCSLPDTDSNDILAVKAISIGGDDLDDALSALQNAVNQKTTLKIGGMSASRLYAKLTKLIGQEKALTQGRGVTSILKSPYETISIPEISCQKTARKVLGGYKYACLVANVTASDSNAPVAVLTSSDRE